MVNLSSYRDKQTPEFWKDIQLGDFIRFSDMASLEESFNRGLGMNPLEFQADRIIEFSEMDSTTYWKAIHLNDPVDNLWLWIKFVDQEFDLKICYEEPNDKYMPLDRWDLVDQDNAWLFSEESCNRYSSSCCVNDLVFAENLFWNREKDEITTEHTFIKKGNIEFICRIKDNTNENSSLIGVIAEYNCPDEGCPDPEIIVFEIGGAEDKIPNDEQRGGLVQILHGTNLTLIDVDVLK